MEGYLQHGQFATARQLGPERAEQLKLHCELLKSELDVVTDDGRAVSGIPRSNSPSQFSHPPTSHNIIPIAIPMPSMAEQDALGISIEFFSFIAKTMYKIRFRIAN